MALLEREQERRLGGSMWGRAVGRKDGDERTAAHPAASVDDTAG